MRIVTTYDRLTATERRQVTCPTCGKKRYVQRTFGQTVNPFNTNDDGTMKTYLEVDRAVRIQASEWVPSEEERSHEKCWYGS